MMRHKVYLKLAETLYVTDEERQEYERLRQAEMDAISAANLAHAALVEFMGKLLTTDGPTPTEEEKP